MTNAEDRRYKALAHPLRRTLLSALKETDKTLASLARDGSLPLAQRQSPAAAHGGGPGQDEAAGPASSLLSAEGRPTRDGRLPARAQRVKRSAVREGENRPRLPALARPLRS